MQTANGALPTFLAYSLANTVSVNAQPCRPAEKHTVPLSGYTAVNTTSHHETESYERKATIEGSDCRLFGGFRGSPAVSPSFSSA